MLPRVSSKIHAAHKKQKQQRIISTKGLLSPEKSKAIMERLKKSNNPTDILERYTTVIESVTDSPLSKGNQVKLLIDGPATYAAMFSVIDGAKDHINIETFIIEDDEIGQKFTELLLRKQKEGVQVNILYDSLGSFKTPSAFFNRLREGGIQVIEFNPVNPLKGHGEYFLMHPDHRKMLIVDGKIAITGGINISNVYSSSTSRRRKNKREPLPWRDTDVQIEGPAVADFQKLFLDTWSKQNGPALSEQNLFPALEESGKNLVRVLGSTPGSDNRITFIAYVAAITFSERSIHLTNAYFVPDDQLLEAFIDAAKRGVDVKILLPSNSDFQFILNAARHNYSKLLKAGVKIYEHRHAVLHAKTAVIDGVWSTIGSTNLDYWSLSSIDEVNAVILNREFALEMEEMFSNDLLQSKQIHLDAWKKRPILQKLKERFAHLFSRWM